MAGYFQPRGLPARMGQLCLSDCPSPVGLAREGGQRLPVTDQRVDAMHHCSGMAIRSEQLPDLLQTDNAPQ
jgi:hypothetical protein